MYIQGHNKKDCVIISVANYLKLDYDTVLETFLAMGLTKETIFQKGIPIGLIPSALSKLAKDKKVEFKKPRRGQEKITGLASWHTPGAKHGHCTILTNGFVLDTDGKIYTLKEYKQTFNYVLRGAYHLI